mgnify:CR=1 FL=1
MRVSARPRFWFTLVALWFGALFWLSSQSHLHPPGPEFINKDKLLHTGYFALGGACLFIGLRLQKPAMGLLAASLITVAFCSAVGAFDEWHQSFVPNRTGNDPHDWLADTLGGIVGAMAGHGMMRFLPPRGSC